MKKHWIMETMVYEIRTFNGVRNHMKCCVRIGCRDMPGVWLVSGSIELGADDSFETRITCIDMAEYTERVNRMHCYSLSITGPVKYAPPFRRYP